MHCEEDKFDISLSVWRYIADQSWDAVSLVIEPEVWETIKFSIERPAHHRIIEQVVSNILLFGIFENKISNVPNDNTRKN